MKLTAKGLTMKLSYWISPHMSDSSVYSIRLQTKKAVLAECAVQDPEGTIFGYPVPVSFEYSSGFDLLDQCSTEDHHYWEAEIHIDCTDAECVERNKDFLGSGTKMWDGGCTEFGCKGSKANHSSVLK